MWNQHIGRVVLAETDLAALVHDWLHFPEATHNHRSEKRWARWAGLEAEPLLKLDVDEKIAIVSQLLRRIFLLRTKYKYSHNIFPN
jgi:hypothetical protein